MKIFLTRTYRLVQYKYMSTRYESKRKWIESNQHGPMQLISLLRTDLFKNGLITLIKEGQHCLFFLVSLYISTFTTLVYPLMLSVPPLVLALSPHRQRTWIFVFKNSGLPPMVCRSKTEELREFFGERIVGRSSPYHIYWVLPD